MFTSEDSRLCIFEMGIIGRIDDNEFNQLVIQKLFYRIIANNAWITFVGFFSIPFRNGMEVKIRITGNEWRMKNFSRHSISQYSCLNGSIHERKYYLAIAFVCSSNSSSLGKVSCAYCLMLRFVFSLAFSN